MCRPTQCSTCGQPTYAGCGKHVEQVLADVPTEDRCGCNASQRAVRTDSRRWPRLRRRTRA